MCSSLSFSFTAIIDSSCSVTVIIILKTARFNWQPALEISLVLATGIYWCKCELPSQKLRHQSI